MKKNSFVDWTGFIVVKAVGPLLRAMPVGVAFWFGRRLGDCVWALDSSHRTLVCAHLKKALGATYSAAQRSALSRRVYQGLGQNIIELLLIPVMDNRYVAQYVSVEGAEHVQEALARGKGIIMLSIHSGSWELSNVVCSRLGLTFRLLVRDQRYPRLSRLLNEYRRRKGFKIVEREGQLRELVRALKNNEAIGMSQDQGGKAGIPVDFFGRQASMPTGAVTLALRYGATILPAFYQRLHGAHIKATVFAPFEVRRSSDEAGDIRDNVQALVKIFEAQLSRHPHDYLWTYRAWKYGLERRVLIISDGKTGHLRQSQAVARTLTEVAGRKGIRVDVQVIEVRWKYSAAKVMLPWMALKADARNALLAVAPDIVISCGSSVAPLNYLVARANAAKAVSVLRPGILGIKRFDAVLMPRHDAPVAHKNVIVTEGALNLIDPAYLAQQGAALRVRLGNISSERAYIGVLLGGDTKYFTLTARDVAEVMRQVKLAAEKLDAYIVVTTSRRTSPVAEAALRQACACYSRCSLMIIANESNIPEAVGGILGVSRVVVTSPESISMVSEAASSGASTIVFSRKVDRRHKAFLDNLVQRTCISCVPVQGVSDEIGRLWHEAGSLRVLDERVAVAGVLERII